VIAIPSLPIQRYTKQVGVFATARTGFYGNAFVRGLSYTRNVLSRTGRSDSMFVREKPSKLCAFTPSFPAAWVQDSILRRHHIVRHHPGFV